MKNLKVTVAVLLLLLAAGAYVYLNNPWEGEVKIRISGADTPADKLISAIIKDKGLDKKNGLDLEMKHVAPGETVRVLTEKVEGIEVGTIPTLTMAELNSSGTRFVAFAPVLWGGLDFIVKPNSAYKSFDDLRGARIAVRPKVSAAYKNLALGMKATGFDLEKDFKITFGGVPENLQSFFKGEVDAVLSAPLGASELIAGGRARPMFDLEAKWRDTVGGRMSFVVLAAHKDWADKNSKTLKKIQKMFLEAEKYIYDNPDALSAYKANFNITTDAGLATAKDEIKRVIPDRWDPTEHMPTIKKAMELGLIKNAPMDGYFIK